MKEKMRDATNLTTVSIIAICITLLVMGLTGLRGTMRLIGLINPSTRDLELQRYEVDTVNHIAKARVNTAVYIGLLSIGGLAVLGGGLYAGVCGLRWLSVKSQYHVIRPEGGLNPLIISAQGIYDANRDNPGVSAGVTMGALQVQSNAALTSNAKVTYTRGSDTVNPALDTLTPTAQLPRRVNLTGLLEEPVTLHNLVLGVGVDGDHTDIVRGDMESLVHVAIGGSSGWGKSVFMQSIAYQLAQAIEKPELCLIDLEGVTLNVFSQSNRLRYPLADSERDAIAVLQDLQSEMERRKALFNEHRGIDKLSRYNTVSDESLPPVVTLIDEATALLDNSEIENILKVLALRARKYGLWLILAGQNWKASTLDTQIRNQLSTRVQFKALNGSQSRVLIGESDAKDLDTVGRAYAVLPGKGMTLMQAPYLSSDHILQNITRGVAQQRLPELQDVTRAAFSDDPELDAEERVKLLHGQGVSLNEIQRRVYGYTGGTAYNEVKRILE